MASAAVVCFFGPQINIPPDFKTNFLMLVRWIHFLAGITWIGLLYFFNLVNVPLMRELDASTKGKVMPPLMTRALLWFRMSAALTVLAGIIYWENIVTADVHNAQSLGLSASHGAVVGSFFLIWTNRVGGRTSSATLRQYLSTSCPGHRTRSSASWI